MYECCFAALERIAAVGKVVSSHALKHGSSGLTEIELVGNLDEPIGGNDGILGVGAETSGVGDAITGLDRGNARADFGDDAGGFLSINEGKLCWITTFAKVHVDKVDANCFDLDECFAGARLGSGNVDEGENFGATGLLNLNGFHVGIDARAEVSVAAPRC